MKYFQDTAKSIVHYKAANECSTSTALCEPHAQSLSSCLQGHDRSSLEPERQTLTLMNLFSPPVSVVSTAAKAVQG